MKFYAMIASAVITASILSVSGYAVTDTVSVETVKTDFAHKGNFDRDDFKKDPIAALEGRKNEILKHLNEGKIPKEEADAIIKKIDARIAEVKNFNTLTLDQKRDKLLKDCKSRLDLLVKDGKLDKKKADDMLKKYTDKIKQWDGVGYPKFFEKGMKGRKH